MKINYKKLIYYILITFLIGSVFAIFTKNAGFYQQLNKPFELPSIVFPIVWSIIYLLLGISAYLVKDNKEAIRSYYIELIVNSFWTLLFFGFKLYLVSFIWLLLLIYLVVNMMLKFWKVNKIATYLNIPYLLWLIFAGYLNFMIYYLN